MLKATAGKILPTTIIGSLPRPSWYTENLGTKSFVDAMANNRFREQYIDAFACYLRDQEERGTRHRYRRRLPVRSGCRRPDMDQLSAAAYDRL